MFTVVLLLSLAVLGAGVSNNENFETYQAAPTYSLSFSASVTHPSLFNCSLTDILYINETALDVH